VELPIISGPKLYVGRSWYRLSKIRRTTVKARSPIWPRVLTAAVVVALGFALRTKIFWWLPITGVALLFGDLVAQHVFVCCRVFVTIKEKEFVIATFTGPRVPFTPMEKTRPLRRAESLVEEINAAIPREEKTVDARTADSEHSVRRD